MNPGYSSRDDTEAAVAQAQRMNVAQTKDATMNRQKVTVRSIVRV
jgi:hypothetical protein